MLNADNPALIDGAGDVLHVSGIPWRRFHGRPAETVTFIEEPVFSPCAGAALYRLDPVREAGGFDASFFMYVEDVDLGFRLLLSRHPCLFVPAARVLHIGSATTGRDSDFTVYHGHRNLVINYVKNMPLALLLLTLPLHLLATGLSLVVLTARGHGATMLRAKKDALAALPGIIAARQPDNRLQTVARVWQRLEKWSLRPLKRPAADRTRAEFTGN
jgi:GT2 family glycosyltransferase